MIDYEKIAAGVMMPEGAVNPPGPRSSREYLPITDERYQNLAAEKGYDQSNSATRLKRTHYTHEAMIDTIIAEPTILQNELAKRFDRSVAWISRILGSDAFQGALAKRREELTDPFLIATIEERFRGLAMQSLDVIAEKLDQSKNADLAIKALEISSKALGFGARNVGSGGGNTQNFVIQLPGKIADAAEWSAAHQTIEHK